MKGEYIDKQLHEHFYAAHSRMACLLQAVLGRLLTIEEQDATYKFLMDPSVISNEDTRREAEELSRWIKHRGLH